jgi:hypothetical protein
VPPTPDAPCAPPPAPRQLPHALWPPLVALAACLFSIDVALRRLEIGRPRAGGDALGFLRPAAAPSRPLARPAPAPYAPGAPQEPVPDEAAPAAPPPPEVDPDSYAGRLLGARRAAKKRMGKGS